MSAARRIAISFVLTLGLLAFAIPRSPGQNPNNPKGIDVSDYQGNNDWTTIKSNGISFAFIKATEGTTFTASTFAANWANAKAAGVVRGSYHFARPGTSPSVSGDAINQANFFINTVKPEKGDLQLACDFELNPNSLTQAQMGAWLTAFVGQINTVTHRPAIVYTYPSFWTSNMPSNWTNPNCGLWIANYGVTSPTVPAPWAGSYAFWQYSSSGSVGGVGINPVDLDTFNGSMSSLLNFTYPRDPLHRR